MSWNRRGDVRVGHHPTQQPDCLLANEAVVVGEALFSHGCDLRFKSQTRGVRSGNAQGLLAQGAVFCRRELFQVFHFDLAQAFETPKRPEAEVLRLSIVH